MGSPFLGFYAGHGIEVWLNQMTILFAEKNLDLKKCVGQGYDGANVMTGAYNGVQKYIKDYQPNGEYVHCANNNLNLIIKYAVHGCVELQNFFAILQDLYNFFGNNIKRFDLLVHFTAGSEITLKNLISSDKMVR